MKKTTISSIIIAISMIVFTTKVQAATGKVTTETLNLRSKASTDSSVVKLLNMDDELEILSEEGNWYKVKVGENEGYVSKDYVKVDKTSTETTTTTTTNNSGSNTTGGSTESTNTNAKPTTSNTVTPNSTLKLEKDVTIKILPLINANNLGTAKAGDEVTVITTANNWIFIETSEIAGWIVKDSSVGQVTSSEDKNTGSTTDNNSDTSNSDDKDEEPTDTKTNTDNKDDTTSSDTNYTKTTKYINASSVYVRKEASTSAGIVTTLIRNTDVTVVGESGDWYKVTYKDYSGYIYKELLSDKKTEETNRSSANRESATTVSSVTTQTTTESTADETSKGQEIVEYAKQYLGCPYVYGGSGDKSFDCSGFTMYVYKKFGYTLSHSAIAQSKVGTYVAKEDLQAGDLVFFLDYETMDGIGHCGIYIGNGEFIHASSGSGYCVKISNLLTGSYNKRYATARRLI